MLHTLFIILCVIAILVLGSGWLLCATGEDDKLAVRMLQIGIAMGLVAVLLSIKVL